MARSLNSPTYHTAIQWQVERGVRCAEAALASADTSNHEPVPEAGRAALDALATHFPYDVGMAVHRVCEGVEVVGELLWRGTDVANPAGADAVYSVWLVSHRPLLAPETYPPLVDNADGARELPPIIRMDGCFRIILGALLLLLERAAEDLIASEDYNWGPEDDSSIGAWEEWDEDDHPEGLLVRVRAARARLEAARIVV